MKNNYAWTNGFMNQEQAHDFASLWNGENIDGNIIKCIATEKNKTSGPDKSKLSYNDKKCFTHSAFLSTLVDVNQNEAFSLSDRKIVNQASPKTSSSRRNSMCSNGKQCLDRNLSAKKFVKIKFSSIIGSAYHMISRIL